MAAGQAIGLCRAPLAAAAPGVVLGVADGIVRIGFHVMASEDLARRRRRVIDLLIGVAAAKRERRNREKDRDPHFASLSSMATKADAPRQLGASGDPVQ